jgi:hypothetical protein
MIFFVGIFCFNYMKVMSHLLVFILMCKGLAHLCHCNVAFKFVVVLVVVNILLLGMFIVKIH